MNPVVLVDDDADHIELMMLALRMSGVTGPVVTFSSGEGCVAAVEGGRLKPQVMLLDMNMPGLDGPATAKQLRALDVMCDVPIVMMSTSDQAFDVQRARAAGADDYMVKPQRDQTWQGVMASLAHYWAATDLGGCAGPC